MRRSVCVLWLGAGCCCENANDGHAFALSSEGVTRRVPLRRSCASCRAGGTM